MDDQLQQLEQAHRDAVRLPIDQVAEMLQQILGQRLTAYAVGVREPKAIGRWARSQNAPRDDTARRLRELYRVARILLARETSETVRAWLIGANPLLGDEAPIQMLHKKNARPVLQTAEADHEPEAVEAPETVAAAESEELKPVLRAAEAFVLAG
jgi:hypothetical protein